MTFSSKNIFASILPPGSDEQFETLWQNKHLQLQRIVSHGHATPPGQWYDEDRDEWVIVLQGSAELRIENQEQSINLGAGDYLLIPAHTRHRVDCTAPDCPTIWLALHSK